MLLKEFILKAFFAGQISQGDNLDLLPYEADTSGPTIQDPSAPTGLEFHFADGAKPLATPWQVAVERAKQIRKLGLPEGVILDPACGSGIQLAAYCAMLGRMGVGIELDEKTAKAACANLNKVSSHGFGSVLMESKIIFGDGTKPVPDIEVGLLHLDPARPRNSRTHSIDEMQPSIDVILSAWKDNLGSTEKGPAILLDLSPRLQDNQREEIEEIVNQIWPNIGKTWVWTSRGGGRIDRLSLWIGQVSIEGTGRRFVRIPPDFKQKPFILDGQKSVISPVNMLPRKGNYVSILDSALVESGLANEFLSKVIKDGEINWSITEGRRPQIEHSQKINYSSDSERLLVQASGKIVKLVHCELSIDNMNQIIDAAKECGFGKLTLRIPMQPEDQPKLQGSLDRQLAAFGGRHTGFVAKHPNDSMLLLCVE